MERETLTSRQKEILEFIEQFLEGQGYPPTIREICNAAGLKSPRSASQHLQALEKKGYVRRGKDKSRAIRVLARSASSRSSSKSEPEVVLFPLLGKVAAGAPALASENLEAEFAVDRDLFGPGDAFLLRVRGESMLGAHILEGDLLVVRARSEAGNGDMVVALIDDEATVKRYVKKGSEIYLVPDNDGMEAIRLSPDKGEARILGKVIGLIRRVW